ncbi:MAG TPA: peptidoglycan-binding domain-containing protein [Gaiellaceae bacterium]|nr:peptidoglycan-binding domain-containing protein [Gaiellaceae bacterium]
MSTRATQSGGPGGNDPRDDWLAGDAADLDWFPEEGSPSTGATGSRAAQGAGRGGPDHGAPRQTSPALEDLNELLRRHGVLIALAGAAVVVVIIAVVVFSGGGSSTPPTTIQTTTQAVTTTPTTTPATTTSTKTTPAHTSQPVTLPPVGYLRSGDTGTQVKALQEALILLGATTLTADGNFGPATATAVTAFQTANGLTADGVVGQKTADTINSAVTAQG